jgi:soluble lytic murein transglycosylase
LSEPTSKFRTVRPGIFLLASCFAFLAASCHSPKLWGLSRDELRSAIDRGDFAAFSSLSDSDYEEASDFDPAAPFALATRLSRAGRLAEGRRLYEEGARRSPEPWRSLCASELVRSGDVAERLASIESLLASGEEFLPGVSLGKGTLQALRQDALLELGQFEGVFGSDPVIRDVRTDVWRKSWKTAWATGKPLLADPERAVSLPRAVISDLGKAALYGAPDAQAEVALFDRLAEADVHTGKAAPGAGYMFAFYAGRLSKKGSDGALRRFARARELAVSAADRDNAIWYSLDARLVSGAARCVDGIAETASAWSNPVYFSDILESCVVKLVQSRDWASLARLRAVVPAGTDADVRVRLDYLVARSPATEAESATPLFRAIAANPDAPVYYRLLASSAIAGGESASGESNDAGADVIGVVGSRTDGPRADEASVDDTLAAVLRSLASWGLEDLVYQVASKAYPDCPPSLACELARDMQKAGHYDDAIRLVLMAVSRSGGAFTREELEIAYPRPWHRETAAAARRFDVGEHVLYALVRSESYFDAGAVSSAGARGLTQLMEPTAADIARKLKAGDFDLADPGTNVTFGAKYLSELTGRLDGDAMAALWAYNAGITRVREWMKSVPPGDTDLLLEGLPYAETREYGRKVLAAAVIYGYLYYQKPAIETVRELF